MIAPKAKFRALNAAADEEETSERNLVLMAFIYGIGAALALAVIIGRWCYDTNYGQGSNDRHYDVYGMAGPLFSVFALSGGICAANLQSRSFSLSVAEAMAAVASLVVSGGVLAYQLLHTFTADSLLVKLSWVIAGGVTLLSLVLVIPACWNAYARSTRNYQLSQIKRATVLPVYMTTCVYYINVGLPILGVVCIVSFLFAAPLSGPELFTYSIFTIGVPSVSVGLSLKTLFAFSQGMRLVLLGGALRCVALASIIAGLVRDAQIHGSWPWLITLDVGVLFFVVSELLVWLYSVALTSRTRPGGGGCLGWMEVATEAWDEKGEE